MISILVRTPNWLGDCIMSLPVFDEIRKAFPSAHIIAACRPHLSACFANHPAIDEVALVPPSGTSLWGLYQNARALRGRRISFGVLLTNSFGTAFWAALAGVRKRVGYSRDLRGMLLNGPFRPTPEILAAHQAEYYLYLLKGIGIDATLSDPHMGVPPEGRTQAQQALEKLGIGEKPYAVIAPFSAFGDVKDWPLERYRAVALELARERGLEVVFTGTPAQSERCEVVCTGELHLHNGAGLTGLEGFFGLLERCTVFVGGDSGGAHAAAALDRPTVSIFGLTEPARTRPLGNHVCLIGRGGETTPNLRNPHVAERARAALAAITAEEVAAAALALLPAAT